MTDMLGRVILYVFLGLLALGIAWFFFWWLRRGQKRKALRGRSLISIDDIEFIYGSPEEFPLPPVIGLLFLEPSTRTRCSFEAAAKRLRFHTISLCDATSSSVAKGETLEDTARMLSGYCDAIIVRHPENGACERVRAALPPQFPIINGGDGDGEHPTQALLDLFAISEAFPQVLEVFKPSTAVTVTLIGDLKQGRTTHSLAKLLLRFNARIQLLAPKGLEMPHAIMERLSENGETTSRIIVLQSLIGALESSDVIYATRFQRERLAHTETTSGGYGKEYTLTDELITANSPPHQIILHPLPRLDEIDVSVDTNPRQRYFKQAADGMYVRMALLRSILSNYGTIPRAVPTG